MLRQAKNGGKQSTATSKTAAASRAGKPKVAGTATIKAPTRTEMSEYLSLQAQRQELQRQARAIEKAENLLLDKIHDFAEREMARTGKSALQMHGYLVQFIQGGVYPKWKERFIEAMGSDAAEQVVAETPPSVKLSVEPIE